MKVDRYYLEINSLKNLVEVVCPNNKLVFEEVNPPNIELNKFFYKSIGKNHRWTDRLVWDNLKWVSYLENKNVRTFILKLGEELVGYFELINDIPKNNSEIAYFGILDNYMGKKFGGYLLSKAIKKSFELNSQRVWVHTCTLDHENALKNYLKRGMKIFKKETIYLK